MAELGVKVKKKGFCQVKKRRFLKPFSSLLPLAADRLRHSAFMNVENSFIIFLLSSPCSLCHESFVMSHCLGHSCVEAIGTVMRLANSDKYSTSPYSFVIIGLLLFCMNSVFEITKVNGVHTWGKMKVHAKFHNIPLKNLWDISLWTDQPFLDPHH